MLGDGRKHRSSIFVGEENLKRMPGEKHQIETTTEPNASSIRFDPSGPLAARLTSCDVEHGGRRIDADDRSTIGQPCRQQAGAAAKIENRFGIIREPAAIVEIDAPLVIQIVELRQRRVVVQIVAHRMRRHHRDGRRSVVGNARSNAAAARSTRRSW